LPEAVQAFAAAKRRHLSGRDHADLLSNAQPISNEVNVIQQLLFN